MAGADQSLGESPVLLPGVASGWSALQLWRGPGGLSRLQHLAGSARIQVMISRGDRFVGDMQHLMLLECTFADFLEGKVDLSLPAEQPLQQQPGAQPGPPAGGSSATHAPAARCCLHAYLAQCPIGMPSADRRGVQPGPLAGLMVDIELPPALRGVGINQINFWASPRKGQSSLHYDPYQNMLVVIEGRKTVLLVPPSATPLLAPQPIYHESANHSPADLAAPDPQRFPALAAALPGLLQRFTLQPGDGLFIPEGWWHQVDSEEGTLAVNFWWESPVSRAIGGCTDRFYFRRLAQSLLEQEKARLLGAVQPLDLAQLARALPLTAGGAQQAGVEATGAGGAAEAAQQAKQRAVKGALLPPREEAALQALVSLAAVAAAAVRPELVPGKGEGAAAGSGDSRDSRWEGGRPGAAGEAAHPPPLHGHHHHHRAAGAAQHAEHVAGHAQRQVEGLLAALAAEQPAAAAGAPPPGGSSAVAMDLEAANAAESPASLAAAILAAAGAVSSQAEPGEHGSRDGQAQAHSTAAAPGAPGAGPGCEPGGSSAVREPLTEVLLALRQRHPAAMRWLLLEGLSPLGWELLLSRLEQAEEAAAAVEGPQAAQERFADFYDRVYSVCEDREALLGLLLARKEQFAQQALRGVLRDELAVRSAHFMG